MDYDYLIKNATVVEGTGKKPYKGSLAVKGDKVAAVGDVKGDIYEGEYIILFGASGSGKSTLMFAIQGSLPPSSGTLLIGGDDIYSYPPQAVV